MMLDSALTSFYNLRPMTNERGLIIPQRDIEIRRQRIEKSDLTPEAKSVRHSTLDIAKLIFSASKPEAPRV